MWDVKGVGMERKREFGFRLVEQEREKELGRMCVYCQQLEGRWVGDLYFSSRAIKLEVGHGSLLLSRQVISRNFELGTIHIMAIDEAQGLNEFALVQLEMECKEQIEENNLRNEVKTDTAKGARKVLCHRCHRNKRRREFIQQRNLSNVCAIPYPFWVIGQLAFLF